MEEFDIFSEKKTKTEIIDDNVREVKNRFTDNLYLIITLMMPLAVIIYNLFRLGLDDKPLSEIVIDTIVSLILGLSIYTSLRLHGIKKGKSNSRVVQIESAHYEKVKEARPYSKYQHEWSELKVKQSLASIRGDMLDSISLNYNDFFDDEGNFLNKGQPYLDLLDQEKHPNKRVRRVARRQLKVINKTLNIKVNRIIFDDLANVDGKRTRDPNAIGQTPSEYIRKSMINQVISMVTVSIFFGRLVPQLQEGAWNIILYQLFQLVSYYFFGLFKYGESYAFMSDKHPYFVAKKIQHLESLIAFGQEKEANEIRRQELERQELERQEKEKQEIEIIKEEVINEQ